MEERHFFQERRERKPAEFTCPFCRQAGKYQVTWLVREKRRNAPGRLDADGRRRFEQARSYMVRLDEQLVCSNIRCRKRFEIPTHQSVVLI